VVVLDEPSLDVEPGGEVRAQVIVTGGGSVDSAGGTVERLRLEVLGDASRWAQVEPRHITVAPGEEQVVELVFRPPHASSASPREIPFGVRALSLEDRDRAAVAEGDILVTPVRDLAVRIEPAVGAGRWGAGYRVRLDNHGIVPVRVRLSGTDPHGRLRFAVAPAESEVPPGGSTTALVSVRTRQPRLAGRPQRHGFAVEYRGIDAGSAGRLSASFEQRAVLPTAVAVVLGLLAAALLVGAVILGVRLLVPAGGASGGPGGGPGPTAPAAEPVTGFYVLYGPPTPVDDVVNAKAAEQMAARLQQAGVNARVVNSLQSEQLDDGPRGLLYVLQDGFPNEQSAQAECAARRALAPACVVVKPR
jgi:hypothetical protein